MGALAHYVAEYPGRDFQPMNANFGIVEEMPDIRDKKTRYEALSLRAKQEIINMIDRFKL